MSALPAQFADFDWMTAERREAGTVFTEVKTPENASVDDLRDLMCAVGQTTQRLAATHVRLQEHVARLQRELAEANAALRRSQALAALGEMAAGIAHEIRNPLGSIQLYSQMLGEDLSDRPPQAELCAKIGRAVAGMDAIVRDVLSFARNTTINPQLTRPPELFERALENCHSMLIDKVQVDRRIQTSQRFHADVGLIVQALSNVIRNAAEAMEEAGIHRPRLQLEASRRKVCCPGGRQEERIVLVVEDAGPGIPPEVIDRVFNPFFTTRKTGTGLGLAIVHRIIDAHGGHVVINNVGSENPAANGTRVELCLPIQPAAAIGPSAACGEALSPLEHSA